MKKLRNLIALLALAGMATLFTGCDDDDGGDDNGGDPNPLPNFAPATEAGLTAQNKTYTAAVAGLADPVVLRFPSAGTYQLTQGANVESGTISAVTRTGESWQFNVTPNAGQQGAREGVLRLDWTGANAGTWTFTPTGGAPESGTFAGTEGGGNTDGGNTDGGNNGGTPGGTDGGTTGPLSGKTLQINYTGGGGDKFQFTSDTAVSWENGTSTGTYTVNAAGDNIDVVLADGQIFDISLAAGNNTTVNYQQNPTAEIQAFSGTYTLE